MEQRRNDDKDDNEDEKEERRDRGQSGRLNRREIMIEIEMRTKKWKKKQIIDGMREKE